MRKLHVAMVAAMLSLAAGAQAQDRKPYIVQLMDSPVASYTGTVPGLAATAPTTGTRLNVNAGHVQAYAAYLDLKQSRAISTVPTAQVTYRYKNILNGFAAFLTEAEVAKLAASSGVKSIDADERMLVDTATTPTYLGINQSPNGVWTKTDGSGKAIKGEGVIIGHLDGGVWPENPSFSDKVGSNGKPIPSHQAGTVVYDPLPAGRWAGVCQTGLGFTAAHCNNKLIGARYFNSTWKLAESLGVVKTWVGEYLDSPRDADGHGSHTLGTSGGNENTDVVVAGSPFTISGIAPRARVAAYKVCFVSQDAAGVPQQGSCFQSDSAAATDQAVADGVDVINFSVGGNTTNFQGVVDIAFANASFAGVFVATSAGNSNVFPTNATTVAHVAPWTMTVGNSTHDRFTVATVTLGNGYQATGPSFQTTGVSSKPLIWSRNAGFDGAAVTTQLAQCFGPADGSSLLDPAKVAGKILICERGGNVLVNKSANAKTAGAAGMILQNVVGGATSVFNLPHAVPTVHLTSDHFAATTGQATAGGTASVAPSVVSPSVNPVMADSSSRGPNRADPHLLKPEITGPGTDIIAAYTNKSITADQRLQIIAGTLVPEPAADMISGTSMSAPHVAGAAALLKQANPTWSPYAIKSTLLTSAVQNVKLANGAVDPSRWGYGAGHMNPNAALATQVVYDQSITDHILYFNRAIDGRQLNIATLTHANVVGTGSLTRTLTNKGSTSVTYSGSASLPGFTVSVSPSTLTIPAGGSASYTVTMVRTTAAIEEWVFGDVTWTSANAQTLRSPLSAKPSRIVALASVSDTRTTGTKVFTAGFGYSGSLFTTGIGMQAATVFSGQIATNARQCYPFTVPTGAKLLRAQLFNADTEGGAASDLDLVVLRGTTTVGSSGGGDSDELVSVSNPTAASTYSVCVDGYAPAKGLASYKVSVWVLGPGNPGTLKAFGPSKVVSSGVGSIGVSWALPANARYLGLVEYREVSGGAIIGTTQVFVDGVTTAAQAAATAKVTRAKAVDYR